MHELRAHQRAGPARRKGLGSPTCTNWIERSLQASRLTRLAAVWTGGRSELKRDEHQTGAAPDAARSGAWSDDHQNDAHDDAYERHAHEGYASRWTRAGPSTSSIAYRHKIRISRHGPVPWHSPGKRSPRDAAPGIPGRVDLLQPAGTLELRHRPLRRPTVPLTSAEYGAVLIALCGAATHCAEDDDLGR